MRQDATTDKAEECRSSGEGLPTPIVYNLLF